MFNTDETTVAKQMRDCPNCKECNIMQYTGPVVEYWTLQTGDSLNMGGMVIPLSSDFIPCPTHLAVIHSKWGQPRG